MLSVLQLLLHGHVDSLRVWRPQGPVNAVGTIVVQLSRVHETVVPGGLVVWRGRHAAIVLVHMVLCRAVEAILVRYRLGTMPRLHGDRGNGRESAHSIHRHWIRVT